MRRVPVTLALVLAALASAPAAFGAAGSLSDADDDSLADVLKLSYANKDTKVVVKMKYDDYRPMVENFYVKWGTDGKYYKLQRNLSGTSLWYSNGEEESQRTCAGDRVRHDGDTFVSTGLIPRSCMPQAPNKVKFQGIVTEGLFESDQTRTSTRVARAEPSRQARAPGSPRARTAISRNSSRICGSGSRALWGVELTRPNAA